MNISKNKIVYALALLAVAFIMKFVLVKFLSIENNLWLNLVEIILIMVIGANFVLKGAANIIEETTEVLSEKTKIASGVLQSIGTGFPDVAFGVTAAMASLSLAKSDYVSSMNFAIIAASTAFGSNIYNIGHATWCVWRQNKSNSLDKSLNMFPFLPRFGKVKPFHKHKIEPTFKEFDVANDIVLALTVLTAIVASSMVLFGRVQNPVSGGGDMYEMVKPVGLAIFIASIVLMYIFRKVQRPTEGTAEIEGETKYFRKQKLIVIWTCLFLSGVAILLAADSMVRALELFSELTKIPVVITGVLTGVISCLGEMIVVHNFSVNPQGRIGDAIVGVAMDNIVTTMAASIVAMLGGIFLGGNALIIIFVIVLSMNTGLMWQISKLKNYYLKTT
ncbi:MAG: hypothetical protein WCJ58_08985 [bacterium]